jgi:hypothetical protein
MAFKVNEISRRAHGKVLAVWAEKISSAESG